MARFGVKLGVLSLIGLLCWRVWAAHASVVAPRVFHDTKLYFSVAKNDIFSLGIWASDRSPLPCVLFKLCQLDPARVCFWSTVISALSWSVLVWEVSRHPRAAWVRLLSASLVVSLALSRQIVMWNDTLLSESLSFSASALFFAALLAFWRQPRWGGIAVAAALFLALCKDSNAYLILLCAAGLALMAALNWRRRRAWKPSVLVAVGFAAVFLIATWSMNGGGRWRYPITNVIVMRLLSDREATHRLQDLGMPVSRALKAHRPRHYYDAAPRLKAFRVWADSDAKHAYIRFLLTNPAYTFGAVSFSELLTEPVERYAPSGLTDAQPAFLEAIWSRSAWATQIAVSAVLSVASGLLLIRRQSSFLVLGLFFALSVYPLALVVWHGDAMEVPRHALPIALQLRFALICQLLGILDVVARRRATEPERARAFSLTEAGATPPQASQ